MSQMLPYIQLLGSEPSPPPTDTRRSVPGPAPCVTYSGKVGGLSVHVAWNGRCKDHGVDHVGTIGATLASYLSIGALKPDIVISAGTAGGFRSKGAQRRLRCSLCQGCTHPSLSLYLAYAELAFGISPVIVGWGAVSDAP